MAEKADAWQKLLLELFSDDMRNDWGWGKILRAAPGTQSAIATPGSHASIDTSGLDIAYFCGRITVDFDKRTVKCHAFDQKTPADEYWDLAPEASWWGRASSCEWPVRKT